MHALADGASRAAGRKEAWNGLLVVVEHLAMDVDVEAACCAKILEDLLGQYMVFTESEEGPALLGDDANGIENVFHACPYCGARVEIVPRDKKYFG